MMKAVIIVSLYKAEAFLDDLFGSLERHYNECGWVKVVAVDDRSPDQSFELVRERYSWVDLIQTQKNFGFAKANNFATEYALKKYNPEFLFYLNQDTEVEEGFLEKLVDVLEKDPSIGIVQPLLMIHPFEQGIVNSSGCRIHYLGYGYTRDEGKKISQQSTVSSQQRFRTGVGDIPYASGAAFMIRSSIVKDLTSPLLLLRKEGTREVSSPYEGEEKGGVIFDPYYVAYHEDTDLSLRIWKEGYRVVLCPESRVAHKYTTPSQVKDKLQANRNAYFWIERNRFVLFAKFYTTWMLVLFFPAFVVNELGVMFFSFFRGFWKERFKMYWWLTTHWGELSQIRKGFIRDRDWEGKLMGLFSTEIWHGNADSLVLPIANWFWKVYFGIVKAFLTSLRRSVSDCGNLNTSYGNCFARPRNDKRVKLKIAHVVSTSPPYEGGMGTVALNLVAELRELGYEADLVSPGHGLRPWFSVGNGNFVPELFWKIKKYDIIHLHYGYFGGMEFILFAKLLKIFRGKLVVHYHNDVIQKGYKQFFVWLDEFVMLKLLFRNADAVIALSRYHLKHSRRLSQYHDLIKNKLHILPNGVDVERFKPFESGESQFVIASDRRERSNLVVSRERLGLLQQPRNDNQGRNVVVGFVGALDSAHYFKGVDDLIEAFGIAARRVETQDLVPLHLLIVGGGDLQSKLEKLARETLPLDTYTFTGSVPNDKVPGYVGLMSFLVLPSYEVESFGIVLIEALAMGKPVIASDLESLKEVVKDETFGLTFRRRDVQDLANKILEMGRGVSRYAPTAAEYRRRFMVEKYSWEKIGKRLEEVYKNF